MDNIYSTDWIASLRPEWSMKSLNSRIKPKKTSSTLPVRPASSQPAVTISHYRCDIQRPFSLGQVKLNCAIFHSTHSCTHSKWNISSCKNDETDLVDCVWVSLQQTGSLWDKTFCRPICRHVAVWCMFTSSRGTFA